MCGHHKALRVTAVVDLPAPTALPKKEVTRKKTFAVAAALSAPVQNAAQKVLDGPVAGEHVSRARPPFITTINMSHENGEFQGLSLVPPPAEEVPAPPVAEIIAEEQPVVTQRPPAEEALPPTVDSPPAIESPVLLEVEEPPVPAAESVAIVDVSPPPAEEVPPAPAIELALPVTDAPATVAPVVIVEEPAVEQEAVAVVVEPSAEAVEPPQPVTRLDAPVAVSELPAAVAKPAARPVVENGRGHQTNTTRAEVARPAAPVDAVRGNVSAVVSMVLNGLTKNEVRFGPQAARGERQQFALRCLRELAGAADVPPPQVRGRNVELYYVTNFPQLAAQVRDAILKDNPGAENMLPRCIKEGNMYPG